MHLWKGALWYMVVRVNFEFMLECIWYLQYSTNSYIYLALYQWIKIEFLLFSGILLLVKQQIVLWHP